MGFPPSSDSKTNDMILGVGIIAFALIVMYRSYFFEYSGIVGDLIVLIGVWVTVSAYYSDGEADEE